MSPYQDEQEDNENYWEIICSIPFSINECKGQATFFAWDPENSNMGNISELVKLIYNLGNFQIELQCKDNDILKNEEKRRIWIVKKIVEKACKKPKILQDGEETVTILIENLNIEINIIYDMNNEQVIIACKDETYIICKFK